MELPERVVGLGVEAGLGHALGDGLAVVQPGDVDDGGRCCPRDADEDVGLAQLHADLGSTATFWGFRKKQALNPTGPASSWGLIRDGLRGASGISLLRAVEALGW